MISFDFEIGAEWNPRFQITTVLLDTCKEQWARVRITYTTQCRCLCTASAVETRRQ